MSSAERLLPRLLLSFLLIAPGASAGELYKCSINGQTKYQDKPCEKGAKTTVIDTEAAQAAPGTAEITPARASQPPAGGSGSVEGLYMELQSAQKQRDDVQLSYQQAMNRATPLFATNEDQQQAELERARLKTEWEPKIAQASERVDAASDRLNARCPTGVRFDKGRYSCNK
ncbi:DUF4124 domain-containing protein [Arenimonas sp.]|uniref:DUF4124 domain-containing protein n=1 Tax=Arenimonas sp. TaxID=1872635 RepID=UPI0039E66D4F